MDFAEMLAYFGDTAADQVVYSVEIRNMLDHETDIRYYLAAKEAIAAAEEAWLQMDETLRNDREISVHKGFLEQKEEQERPRFVVQQKLFKAYKKLYVAEDYAKAYLAKRKADYLAKGAASDDKTAVSMAKADFQARFAIQNKVACGMFADYNYGPDDPERF